MLSLLTLCGILLVSQIAAQEAEADILSHLRGQSDRYLKALKSGNRPVLEQLLHKDFQLRFSPDFLNGSGRKEFIAEFTNPQTGFSSLNQHAVSFRVFGATVIESGSISGKRGISTWGKMPYSRVWVKEGKAWLVVHEHIQ